METMRAIVLVTCVISILSGLLDVLKPVSYTHLTLPTICSV